MRYQYQSSGHPIIRWKGLSAPSQTRAADAVSLGSLSEPTLVLPRGGAPEPINNYTVPLGCSGTGKSACGCSGCAGGMGSIVDTVAGLSLPVKIAGAVGIYLLYKKLKKR